MREKRCIRARVVCAEEYWKIGEERERGAWKESRRNVVERKVRIRWIAEERRAAWKHKAVVLKRFWSHNQEKKSESTKEWALKRKLHGCVYVCLCSEEEEEENGEGQFRMRVRSLRGKWKKCVRSGGGEKQ